MTKTPVELLTAAKELVGKLEPKEADLLRHAIGYLRRHHDLNEFKRFLNTKHYSATSEQYWPKTRSTIAELVARSKDVGDVEYILGWAWRLRKVYGKPETRGGYGRGRPVFGRGYGGRGPRRDQPRRDGKRW